ncbi:MAG: iron chelate uptake ABC transporter family permease subunit, partial [Aurantimonas coralicida]
MSASSALDIVVTQRHRQARRRALLVAILLTVVVLAAVLALTVGQSYVPVTDVVRVMLGEEVPGAAFTVGVLRLPRTILSILAGASFGLGGVAFQI